MSMHVLVLLSTFTSAADLTVAVTPDPPRPARRRHRPVRSVIPLAHADVVVDGVLDDSGWASAPVAPTLGPYRVGVSPPENARVKVALTEDGLAVAGWGLPVAQRITLDVDPDGLRQRWLSVRVGAEGPTLWECGWFAGQPLGDRPASLPTHSMPCHPLEAEHLYRRGRRMELLLPWPLLGRATTAMTMRWTMLGAGPQGPTGGTWAPWGKMESRPELGYRADLPMVSGSLRARRDPLSGALEAVDVHLDAPVEEGAWVWRWVWAGGEISSGELVVDGAGTYSVASYDLDAAVEVSLEVGPQTAASLAPVLVGRFRDQPARAWVTRWVVGDEVEARWSTPVPLRGLPVQLRCAGRVVGQTAVDLPAGTGTLSVAVEGVRGEATLTLGQLMVNAPIWFVERPGATSR